MTARHITETSPASIGILRLIGDNPDVQTSDIAERGGWSVYHVRNVLRYLRKVGRITSTRPIQTGECYWRIGAHEVAARAEKPKPAPVAMGPSSVFQLGAM